MSSFDPLPADTGARLPTGRVTAEEIAQWPFSEALVDQLSRDAERIRLTRDLALLTPGVDEPLNQLVDLARTLIQAPVAFLGAVAEDFDHYKAIAGVGEPLATERRLKGRTFCHYTHAAGRTLALDDTRALPAPWCQVPTVQTLGVAAYLGTPVRIDGQVVASLCVIDTQPRSWTERDRSVIEALATSFERELQYRVTLASWRRLTDTHRQHILHAERQVAGIAHDLRTPLMVTQLCAASLASRPSEDSARSTAPRLKQAASVMRNLIAELQTERLPQSGAPLQLSLVDAADLLRQALHMFQPLAAREQVVVLMGRVCDAQLQADHALALRALGNLLGNALKFSRAGSEVRLAAQRVDDAEVRTRLGEAEAGRRFVEMSVTDQGAGMSADELARCTERGYQGADSLARGDGSGLGLAIVTDIVEQHGGRLVMHSQPGQGTRAALWWPESGAGRAEDG